MALEYLTGMENELGKARKKVKKSQIKKSKKNKS
jgi:hypothetical protein